MFLVAVTLAFIAGAGASFGYFFSKITRDIDTATESVLLEKTMVLQFLREGYKVDAEHQLDSISWNQMISLGHRIERGEPLPKVVRPAVDYHCEYFQAHKNGANAKLEEQRAYWCSVLQKR